MHFFTSEKNCYQRTKIDFFEWTQKKLSFRWPVSNLLFMKVVFTVLLFCQYQSIKKCSSFLSWNPFFSCCLCRNKRFQYLTTDKRKWVLHDTQLGWFGLWSHCHKESFLYFFFGWKVHNICLLKVSCSREKKWFVDYLMLYCKIAGMNGIVI